MAEYQRALIGRNGQYFSHCPTTRKYTSTRADFAIGGLRRSGLALALEGQGDAGGSERHGHAAEAEYGGTGLRQTELVARLITSSTSVNARAVARLSRIARAIARIGTVDLHQRGLRLVQRGGCVVDVLLRSVLVGINLLGGGQRWRTRAPWTSRSCRP